MFVVGKWEKNNFHIQGNLFIEKACAKIQWSKNKTENITAGRYVLFPWWEQQGLQVERTASEKPMHRETEA